jgi:ankyrin repeat protein
MDAAVMSGRVDVVQALLAKGADVNAKDESGLTALMWASRNATSMLCRR